MNRVKLGVRLESLGLPLRLALREAEKMGAAGVQVDALGDLAPQKLTDTGRRELRNLLRSHGVQLTALGCPLRRGLDVPEDLQPRIDRIREVMALSFDLGARVVIIEAGRVPDKDDDPRMNLMRESLDALGRHGDRIGCTVALETGLESGPTLKSFLERFDTGGLGVNYDPANLLTHNYDPMEALRVLRGHIVHAHAKDARESTSSRSAQEVPLGHGDLDWMTLMVTLATSEYDGWLVVERESGDNRVTDVSNGLDILRRFNIA